MIPIVACFSFGENLFYILLGMQKNIPNRIEFLQQGLGSRPRQHRIYSLVLIVNSGNDYFFDVFDQLFGFLVDLEGTMHGVLNVIANS